MFTPNITKQTSDIRKILATLSRQYPHAGFGTDMGSVFHTLIATMLSAQTTDAQVLKMYPAFRVRFPDASSLATAPLRDIERLVSSVNYFRTKARHIKQTAAMLVGKPVPKTMEELLTLPGVGRKTASIILACCYGIPAIAIDTHAHRVANRLGIVKTKMPAQTEKKLLELVPRELWISVNRTMVPFGREFCTAHSPKCYACPVARLCAYQHKSTKPKSL